MSLVPHRMVPAGKRLILTSWHATENRNKRTAIRIRSTDFEGELQPGVFIFKDAAFLTDASTGEVPLGDMLPALSIVKVTAWATVTLAGGSASWKGYLVDD